MMKSEKKPLILMIGSVPPPFHGSNVYFQNLLNSKIRDKFDITHLDISDHRNANNLAKLDFINVYLAIKHIIQLIFLLKKYKPQIIYIPISAFFLPYLRDGLFILCAFYFSNAAVVIHLHRGFSFRNRFYEKSNFIIKLFIKQTLKKVHTAIVLGENLKKIFEGLVVNVVSIPNGIALENLNGKKEVNRRNNEFITVSYLGSFLKNKGVFDLLEAIKIITVQYPSVKFEFAGEWRNKEEAAKYKGTKFINENNFTERIKFNGLLIDEEKKKFLLKSDIFAFPSWDEGFPLVILEAMASNCPVISTVGVGAIPEVVVDGVTGILIEKQNPKELADAIMKLIEDPIMRKKMGEAGKKRFKEYYTLDKNIQNMISVFRKVLETH